MLRPAVRLYQNLTQILRLCLPGPFDPKSAGPGLLSLLARAADVPDFATLEAHLAETQASVRASFVRILGQGAVGEARLRPTASRGIGSSSIVEGAASTGSRTSTIVPVPSVERMRIAPPCSSVSDFAIARPRPEPRWVLVSWLSTCSNGLPRLLSALLRDADAGVLDGDVDMTVRPSRARTVMRPPSGVNFTALDNRLIMICLIMRRSARSRIDGLDLGLDGEPLLVGARRDHAHGVGQEGVELDRLVLEA